jgi:hypothetical protein
MTPSENASVAISMSGLLAAMVALFRVGVEAGRFREFKETTEQNRAEDRKQSSSYVRREEFSAIEKHIDRRFDALDRQVEQLRVDLHTLSTSE